MARQKRAWSKWKVRSGFEHKIKEKLEADVTIHFKYEDKQYTYIKLLCPSCGEPCSVGTYTPDFNFYSQADSYLFTVEAKGLFDSEDRTKLIAVRKANPDIDLRILFQRDQAIRKGSKTKYSDWCIKHDFIWAVGEDLPPQWLLDAKK